MMQLSRWKIVIWAADNLATPAGTLIEELDGFLTTLRAG